jgi:surface protein
MSYVPDLVALYEINPFIILELDNESIRVSVKDYIEGGKKKDAIIKKYGSIGEWNTSEVTDMSFLFCHDINFNEDISKWDVSKVTDMRHMFHNAAKSFDLENAPWYHE